MEMYSQHEWRAIWVRVEYVVGEVNECVVEVQLTL